VNVWRVRAEVTAADGVVFVREAVVRPNPDPRRLLTILAWQEGERGPPPAPEESNANK
jgi:hypothetical protein